MTHMVFFGYGFCAAALAPLLQARGWRLSATTRDADKAEAMQAQGITPILWPSDEAPLAAAALDGITHGLLSAAPTEQGDPILRQAGAALAAHSRSLQWLGYLSTTGVYGDHQGAWVDEDTPAGPIGRRGMARVAAEAEWQAFAEAHDVPVMMFRLAGIYGPYRNQLRSVSNGTARRIDKPGQVFSRIHVDDIAQILAASIDRPKAGRAYSVCDDEPAAPEAVVRFAAELLGVEPPPLVPFAEAELSPMGRSFYADNKRLRNQRIKQELGVTLAYPSYREGLTALFNAKAY
jgi:nucleoside-diphosphate-sugar epimerase